MFAHPQNQVGADNALNGGVDILAHTIPTKGSFTPEELAQMRKQHTALIPTLTLWTTVVQDPKVQEQLVGAGVSELKSYFAEGGTILFGTDVGFTSKYDTTRNTNSWAGQWDGRIFWRRSRRIRRGISKRRPRAAWKKAWTRIFVVLDADPAADVKNFAKVKYTVKSGKVIYEEK